MNKKIIRNGEECSLEYKGDMSYTNNQSFDDQEYIKFLEDFIDDINQALDYYILSFSRTDEEEIQMEELVQKIYRNKWKFKQKKNNRKIINHMEKTNEII